MNTTLKRCASIFTAGAIILALQACSGGASGGSAENTSAPITITGVTATGAAFAGAIVTVKDRNGAVVGSSSAVGADGAYSITLNPGATAPFVLIASRTSALGAIDSMVSVAPGTTGASATVNITPVTTLIAARLASSGNPLKLADEVAANPAVASTSAVEAKVQEVQAILAPILVATSTTNVNPLSGTFTTNGAGYDRLLDSIKITITLDSATSSNIEIGIKQQVADGAQPTTITFSSSTPAASVPTIPTVDPGTLIAEGTNAKIAAHLAQLNTCYALPTATRVNNPNPSGATAVNGASEGNITAAECRSAFVQDGAGAILFKSNGSTIGAAANKSFRGLFFDGGTGVVFSQGAYEFTRANGDIVVSYRSTNASGAETYDVFALRLDPADGKLKQIGNQYNYPGNVSPYHQLRRFITLGQSAWDYYSTGYTLNVPNSTSAGNPVFDRVEVTTPRGVVLTLKPTSGSSELELVKPSGTSLTSFVRLNSEYADTANLADPSLKDNTLFFADRTVFTNLVISQIPMQAVWTFNYFLAGNTGALPDATQNYKTRARALTIPELKTKGLAAMATADISNIQAGAIPGGQSRAGQFPIGSMPSITINYTVPAGALPPIHLKIWGTYATNGSFNDDAPVASTATNGTIYCTKATTADTHCPSVTAIDGTGPYDATAAATGAHLRARDPAGRDYASFYAMYQLP